jgi:cytidylate kinase
MMLSRTEREQRVIELYHQGKKIREIAQEVHMSFADIGAIVRKVKGSDDDKPIKEKDNMPHTSSVLGNTLSWLVFPKIKPAGHSREVMEAFNC